MDAEAIQALMRARLTTTEQMRAAATALKVSTATLYRYKADPNGIPFGKLLSLGKLLGFPIQGSVTWMRGNVIQGERRRLDLEEQANKVSAGRSLIAPAYSVNVELPEVTRFLWQADYGRRHRGDLDEYVALRSERNQLYLAGGYSSREILGAAGYREFFNSEGRFAGMPKRLRSAQHKAILDSLELKHVQHRIRLAATPEISPLVSYASHVAYVRIDDLMIEFSGPMARELQNVFDDLFDSAELRSVRDVHTFLRNPND